MIEANELPKSLAEDLMIIKDFGNRGAHASAEIDVEVDVTYEEACWLLDILERLFDLLFVGPRRTRERREAFNEKRGKSGLQPIDFDHLPISSGDESQTVH